MSGHGGRSPGAAEASIRRWLPKRGRYHLHFTPTSASWLNLVERRLADPTEQQIRRAVHRRVRDLEEPVARYITAKHIDPRPFVSTKTADPILESLARYCERLSVTGH